METARILQAGRMSVRSRLLLAVLSPRTTSTSQGACFTTRAAVLPNSSRSIPVCPTWATTSSASGVGQGHQLLGRAAPFHLDGGVGDGGRSTAARWSLAWSSMACSQAGSGRAIWASGSMGAGGCSTCTASRGFSSFLGPGRGLAQGAPGRLREIDADDDAVDHGAASLGETITT